MVAQRTFTSVGETRKHLRSEAISGMEAPTLLNTRAGAHGHVISHICITGFLLKTSPNVTLVWAEAPKAPDLSDSNYVCGAVPMGELSRQPRVEMNCRLDLKGLLFLITTWRNFWPFLLWSLKLFDSRFKLYTFFFFWITDQLREQTGLSGLFLNIYCISSSVLLYVECWKCYILYRMHYVISDLLFLYNQ